MILPKRKVNLKRLRENLLKNELHQKLVNAIYNQINQEDLSTIQENIKKEEIKQLRLQRKLKKNRNNNITK